MNFVYCTSSHNATSLQLRAGTSFGSLEGGNADHTIKNNYPMYYNNQTCTLLRIAQVDYQRVLQVSIVSDRWDTCEVYTHA